MNLTQSLKDNFISAFRNTINNDSETINNMLSFISSFNKPTQKILKHKFISSLYVLAIINEDDYLLHFLVSNKVPLGMSSYIGEEETIESIVVNHSGIGDRTICELFTIIICGILCKKKAFVPIINADIINNTPILYVNENQDSIEYYTKKLFFIISNFPLNNYYFDVESIFDEDININTGTYEINSILVPIYYKIFQYTSSYIYQQNKTLKKLKCKIKKYTQKEVKSSLRNYVDPNSEQIILNYVENDLNADTKINYNKQFTRKKNRRGRI